MGCAATTLTLTDIVPTILYKEPGQMKQDFI